jgi:RNA polymerase sigma-70 factor (ECF subfamily)
VCGIVARIVPARETDTWGSAVDTCKHHDSTDNTVIAALLARLFRSGPGADLQAAQDGDRGAIARFYDAHVDGLYTFVFYRVGRDATLAEDVVQETFTVALARRADYDAARGSIASWLTVLSRNVIRDHLRAHRRADELQATWERIDATLAQTFAAMAERPLPGDVLERAETRDLVHMAVANLPGQYRNALTRKYVDGESLETLASELGISVDAAKSLLARARRAFRDTFATLSAHFSEVSP